MSALSILVIDRDPSVGGDLSRQLIQRNGKALMVRSIKQAKEAHEGDDFDAILLDLQLPEIANLDGLGTVLELFAGVPVIALAAEGEDKSARRLLLEARHRGATYLLRKPLDMDETVETVLDAAALKRGEPRRHVLLVDDSPTILQLASEMLDGSGYHVSSYPVMEDAMRAMVLMNIDVVVTDIFMPGIGGLEGVSRIRKAWPDMGVVAMSSGLDTRMSMEEALRAAEKTGAMRTLSKPFEKAELLDAVQAVLPKANRQTVKSRDSHSMQMRPPSM